MENKYMFVLCPPASGSTLLHKLLQTSPHTSAFACEGQVLAKDIIFTEDRWDPEKPIPWEQVKAIWQTHWNLQQPILLEKSPPNLVRPKQLQKHFSPCYFVIMIRNPYAFCEGVKRRWGKAPLEKFYYCNLAKFWIECATHQMNNINALENSIWFTYEELTTKPAQTCQKILQWLPELEHLDYQNQFTVFERASEITDLNQQQIARLTEADILEINTVLQTAPHVMAFFNYSYIQSPNKEQSI